MCKLFQPFMINVNDIINTLTNTSEQHDFSLTESRGLFTDGFMLTDSNLSKQTDMQFYLQTNGLDVKTCIQ